MARHNGGAPKQGQPSPGAPARSGRDKHPPQPPAEQQLHRRQPARPDHHGQSCQGPVPRQGCRAEAEPKQGTPGQGHFHQAPEGGTHQGRGQTLGPQPTDQGAPTGHQHASEQAASAPKGQAKGQAQRPRHTHPIEGMEPEQPAMADQHGDTGAGSSSQGPQAPEGHQGQPEQGRPALGRQGQAREQARQAADHQGGLPLKMPVLCHGNEP